ncbi:MAG: quinone-dependent dihydroorotate dehydrogenase [Granulosicoccaceae bacterium]
MTKPDTAPDAGTIAPDPIFKAARALLFKLDPERSHNLTLRTLALPPVRVINRKRYQSPTAAFSSMGLQFANRVGLAAGLDKNGDYIDALGALGFGSIEIGTITPKPQDGNPKPRMFRLVEHEAIINRMGFNNKGIDHLVKQAERRRYEGVLGINIGKNASTELDNAVDDYLICLERAYPVADYITVNVSSPNTQGLRDLQHGERLEALLQALKNRQAQLATQHGSHKPLLVKIAPDMTSEERLAFCQSAIDAEIDGVISGNTSNQRQWVAGHQHEQEQGGLSGAPIKALADESLAEIASEVGTKMAVIGVGGINCGNDAKRKLELGADWVQLYSGLIYQGPALVQSCIRNTA